MSAVTRTTHGTKFLSLLISLQALHVADSPATDLAYSVDLGAGYTDNIRLTSNNQRDETIATGGLQLSLAQLSKRIDANLVADLAYYDYLRNTYDAEVVGSFAGGARLAILPERFVWIFQDNFGQGVRDIFAAVSPSNRENINYFTTGPELTSRFSDEIWARLSAQYSKVSYEKSLTDNDRYAGSLGLFKDLSSASTVSANIHASRIKYDSDVAGPDFDENEAYLQYFTSGGRTTASVDLGYSELKRGGPESTKNKGLLTRVSLARQVSAATRLTLNVGREFSDQGSSFQFQQGLGGVNLQTQGVTQATDPFTSKYANLGVDFQRGRTGLGAGIGYYKESYQRQVLFDRKRIKGDLRASRTLTPSLQLSLSATYDKESFENTLGDYRDIDALLDLNWRLSRYFSVIFEYDRLSRSGSAAGNSYDENRAWLKLQYGRGLVKTSPTSSTQPASTAGISGR